MGDIVLLRSQERLYASPTRGKVMPMRCVTHLAATFVAAVLMCLPAVAEQLPTNAPISGLVTMGKLNFVPDPSILPDNSLREVNTHPGVYAGAVILATWKQLEPSTGRYDFTVIEDGLQLMRRYNERYPRTPLRAKLRVFGGPNAPSWAKQLDGGPVMLHEHDRPLEVGHFWSRPYRAAWATLQRRLAARYDANPLLAEVAISSCTASTAEPFVIPLNNENIGPLLRAGYNDSVMQECLLGAIDDYAPWRTVALDYTFNPWRSVATGHARPSPGFAESVIERFRARYGARAVIANHGLTPEVNPMARGVMETIRRLGPPIEFQTRSPKQDWPASIRTGEELGVTEMEIWESEEAGGAAPVTMNELQQWRSELAGHAH